MTINELKEYLNNKINKKLIPTNYTYVLESIYANNNNPIKIEIETIPPDLVTKVSIIIDGDEYSEACPNEELLNELFERYNLLLNKN